MAKKGKKLHILLDVSLDGDEGGHQEFDQKSVIIGSGPTAQLQLDDDSVSSMHAILQASSNDDEAMIVDLGSENGISINADEVEREGVVHRGDTLSIGDVEIFVIGVGPDAIETKAEKLPAGEADEDGDEFESEPTNPDAVPVKAEAKAEPMQAKVEKKPLKPPPKRSREKSAKDAPAGGTQVVRLREIPRHADVQGSASGQNFYERELAKSEQPRKGDRSLEVKVMWGPIVLDARQFFDVDTVSVGDTNKASFQIGMDRFPGEVSTLASPGGTDGHVVHVASGMELDVRRKGENVDVDELPSQAAVRTYPLKLGDRARVTVGQLAFIIQYTSTSRGVHSSSAYTRDFQMGKWWWTFMVLAIGMWFAIDATPKDEFGGLDYLKNPARFAQMIMPTNQQDKKTFDEIKKKKEQKLKPEDDAKWKKLQSKVKTKKPTAVPREVKREQDRKVATNAGILGLLKKKGGGTGDNASSVFGGAAMTSLDESLESLNKSGMGDSGGFGGLGTRGGGPGGGSGLGLGGLGTAGYGRGSGVGTGSVKIGHRGKAKVRIRKGRTRIIGGLSQEVVGRYIKRYWAQFKFCYERELSKAPNLYGKITTTFTIAGNGRVTEAQTLQSTMHNNNVEQCLLRVIRRIRFPAPKGGGEVIVTYPFMFTTAG
jgi:TonB family protein